MRKLLIVFVVALISMQIQAQTYNFVIKAGHVTKVYPISKIKKMYFTELWYNHDEVFQIHYDDGHFEDIDMKTINYINLYEKISDKKYIIQIFDLNKKITKYDLNTITKIKLISKLKTGLDKSVEIFPVMTYPNPFNSSTKIVFSLFNPANVSVSIIDVRGQTMREIENSFYPAGECEINWDGNNNSGVAVPTGIYYALININGETKITKVVKID